MGHKQSRLQGISEEEMAKNYKAVFAAVDNAINFWTKNKAFTSDSLNNFKTNHKDEAEIVESIFGKTVNEMSWTCMITEYGARSQEEELNADALKLFAKLKRNKVQLDLKFVDTINQTTETVIKQLIMTRRTPRK